MHGCLSYGENTMIQIFYFAAVYCIMFCGTDCMAKNFSHEEQALEERKLTQFSEDPDDDGEMNFDVNEEETVA